MLKKTLARRRIIAAAIFVVSSVGAATGASVVRGLGFHEPIIITGPKTFAPGDPLPCNVTLDGGPEQITIYSDPPGAVSFTGALNGATGTVQASTSASTTPGTVTVYLITDGATVVSTTTNAAVNAPTGIDDGGGSSGVPSPNGMHQHGR